MIIVQLMGKRISAFSDVMGTVNLLFKIHTNFMLPNTIPHPHSNSMPIL